MTSDSLLGISLGAAVPLWIERIIDEGWTWPRVATEAQAAGQIVAEKGDVILYKSKKAGETAGAFNALAKGIACLAFAPGGVTVFGQHWEADVGRLAQE